MEGDPNAEPFFSKIRHKFQPIPSDKQIEVEPFLAATREVLDLLDLFGYLLKPVKSDINGNITTLHEKYCTQPSVYRTFNDMLNEESNDGSAYVALLWLKRALDFLCNFITLLIEDHKADVLDESLSTVAHTAYERSLEPYHNFIVRSFSRMLLRLIPCRTNLYKSLTGHNHLSQQHAQDIAEASKLLTANLSVINQLFPEHERSTYIPEESQSESTMENLK